MMLARQYRLTKNEDFDKVKREGKPFQSKFFQLLVLNRGDNDQSRFGFVVSNKISKNATARNKIKRALREGARQSLTYLKPGYDCVLLVRNSAERAYTDEMMKEVMHALEGAELLK